MSLTPIERKAWQAITNRLQTEMVWDAINDQIRAEADQRVHKAFEKRIRNQARKAGFALRRNLTRDRGDDQYGLYALVDVFSRFRVVVPDDSWMKRATRDEARLVFQQGQGASLFEIVDALLVIATVREAHYQGLRLIRHLDGTWELTSPDVELAFASHDEVSAYLTEDEHCIRCQAPHPDECSSECPWWENGIDLVCPECLTANELRFRQANA